MSQSIWIPFSAFVGWKNPTVSQSHLIGATAGDSKEAEAAVNFLASAGERGCSQVSSVRMRGKRRKANQGCRHTVHNSVTPGTFKDTAENPAHGAI